MPGIPSGIFTKGCTSWNAGGGFFGRTNNPGIHQGLPQLGAEVLRILSRTYIKITTSRGLNCEAFPAEYLIKSHTSRGLHCEAFQAGYPSRAGVGRS